MKNDIDFIPSGDELKNLVSQQNCSSTMINNLLRERGLFCGASDKSCTVPNLITSLLSPDESFELLDSIKTKEKLDKVNFRNFNLKQDVDLLEEVSGFIDAGMIVKNGYINYEITDFSDFTSLDGKSNNAVIMEFEICKTDILDDWYITEKFFKGSVEVKKDNHNITDAPQLLMNVKLNHTSPETKEIAENVMALIEGHLEKNNIIENSPHRGRVLMNDFENENRVKFLNELASLHIGYLFYHQKIDDVHFNPDHSTGYESQSDAVTNFLEKDIEQYRVKGNLENIISIKWKHIHPYVRVTKVVASYTISHENYSGECKVAYEFSEYGRKISVNPELCITFINIKVKGASPSKIHEIQSSIMREIELRKVELLAKYKKITASEADADKDVEADEDEDEEIDSDTESCE
ncbi:GapS4b family protein [Enterobacter cloacae]|uniref:GapS4b family protein n=1 Tax=Enterobacter cloacae TaxID=550 RepID=UPI003985246B